MKNIHTVQTNYFYKINHMILRMLACVLALAILMTGCGQKTVATPENITAQTNDEHTVCIQWDSVDKANDYTVTLSQTQSQSEPTVLTVEENKAVFENLKADTEYNVQITANMKKGKKTVSSAPTEAYSIKTKAPIINVVQDLTVTANGSSEIDLSWTALYASFVNADGSAAQITYVISVSDSSEDGFSVLASDLTETAYQHIGLEAQTTKYYKIYACIFMDGKMFNGTETDTAVVGTTHEETNPETGVSASEKGNASSSAGSNKASGSNNGSGSNKGSGTSSQSSSSSSASSSSSSSSKPQQSEKQRKEAEAMAVARKIANSIGPGSDLERVEQAASIVSEYCDKATYTMEGEDYKTAYGVFIKGEYSCAGATRALGMVLTCMGYKWEHVNENLYTHQWCRLVMDGEVGWADGQMGCAGYGSHPIAEQQ